MAERYELCLSGFGGQGLILAGIILAEAIGIHEGKYVSQTQSYGPEARGGKSKAEVVVSDEPIDYPKPTDIDLLLAMSQDACDTYYIDLKAEGILVVDSTFVSEVPSNQAISVPCTKIATDLGLKMVANIVSLGAISEVSDIVSYDSLKKAILSRAPKGTEKLNLAALSEGAKAAKKAML
jgi:2-oxoglutarate ferredoxin oxidoreductase subunit gamma